MEGYLTRQKKYDDYNHSFGNRNSFSKTDRDATFMRMKEDMKNGQLKPAYNVTLAVDAEYIVNAMISQERSDVGTFIPMMEKADEKICHTMPMRMPTSVMPDIKYEQRTRKKQSQKQDIPSLRRFTPVTTVAVAHTRQNASREPVRCPWRNGRKTFTSPRNLRDNVGRWKPVSIRKKVFYCE